MIIGVNYRSSYSFIDESSEDLMSYVQDTIDEACADIDIQYKVFSESAIAISESVVDKIREVVGNIVHSVINWFEGAKKKFHEFVARTQQVKNPKKDSKSVQKMEAIDVEYEDVNTKLSSMEDDVKDAGKEAVAAAKNTEQDPEASKEVLGKFKSRVNSIVNRAKSVYKKYGISIETPHHNPWADKNKAKA